MTYKTVSGYGSGFGLRVTELGLGRYHPREFYGRLKRTGTGKEQWSSNGRTTCISLPQRSLRLILDVTVAMCANQVREIRSL